MKVESLKMIGFGTKGDDGIDEGIHLRWSFNDKLGFPSCFKLYRRESDFKNKYEFPVSITDFIPNKIDIPFKFQPNPDDKFSFKIDSAKTKRREKDTLKTRYVTLEDGSLVRIIPINGEITFLFSKPVSRIELKFVLTERSDFEIKMLTKDGKYYPYHIAGETTGLQNISFDAFKATGIRIRGKGIKLHWLAVWVCNDGKGWNRINNLCGCGLPVNLEGTDYLNDVYPPIIGRDLATVLCRLGFENEASSPITLLGFLELKGMLLSMLEEGSEVPVGWTLFPNEEDASVDREIDASESLEFSKYDFLLTQSIQVFFAQILDMYFVDTDAETGKTYDYKITAKWPEGNKRRLDHEITFEDYEVGEEFYQQIQLDAHTVLTTTINPEIIDAPYELFRTVQGLNIPSENIPVILSFLQAVTEVQLVLINPDFNSGSEIVVEAYKNLVTTYIDREVLTAERGILRLRAEQIDNIKIHAPQFTICRIHYDFEMYPKGLQEYIVSGLFKHTHLPLSTPTDLTASLLPGGTHNDQDGNITEKPYMAGLHWKVNENPEKELISIAPVLYHVERKPEGSTSELLTEDAPLFVSPAIIEDEERDVPLGWPLERQYFTDMIDLETQNDYRIAALDLFGRLSAYTDPETYELTLPRPPHPIDVTAKYLDFSTFNPADDTFKDSTINIDDKNWLRANTKNAIVVRWKWPANLQLQAPNVEAFKVHYQPGWLNTYTGIITTIPVEDTLTKSSLNLSVDELAKFAILDTSPTDIPIHKFEIALDQALPSQVGSLPDGAFRLCWLTQGNHSFLILTNTGLRLWALKVNDVPKKDHGFGIAVTPENDFFINYQDPNQWTDLSISCDKRRIGSAEEYIVYIENPAFPAPSIQASDTNKVRYAQIGVNSYQDQIEGSVSPASTIMALYWDTPAVPLAFGPIAGNEILALKAGPANIHGKSKFSLTWNDSGAGLKYHIFRALDETLFKTDNALRPNRSNSIYTNFKNDYDFDPADVDVIQNIPHEPDPTLVESHYTGLTPGQLQILACLPDNVNAYSKINEGAIEENTGLYIDKTLNGQSNNRYFYALKSVDTNGLQSILSLATPPVEIPKTTPPPVPVITAVNGGENKVILKWAKNPGANIAGYLVYRTQDPKKARDTRKMELIKTNDTDIYSVSVNGSLPEKDFEFEDASAIARQAYYYGVVAVGLADGGKWLPSRISQTVVGQAYDVTPPEPPLFSLLQRIENEDSMHIQINWQSNESLECKLKRSIADMALYKVISDLIIGNYNPISNYWEYEFIDTNILSDTKYVYQIFSTDLAGNVAMSLVSPII